MANISVVGRIVSDDIELKISANNKPYLRFDLSERTGKGPYARTQYYQVVAFGATASQFAKKGLHRGALVSVEGVLELEDYLKRDSSKIQKEQERRITVPVRGVWVFSAVVSAAPSASAAENHGQTVLPLLHSAGRQHPACCHTSSADRIFRRRRLLPAQRQSVPCRDEYPALRPSAPRHPHLRPALSDRHTVSAHPPARQHIWIPVLPAFSVPSP